MSFFAYHGYTTAEHKNTSDKYLALGYKYLVHSVPDRLPDGPRACYGPSREAVRSL